MNIITDSIIHIVENNGCIVYPTSTLPALGCRPTSKALDQLFTLKNRPAEMPVSLAVANLEQAKGIVELSDFARDLIEYFPDSSLSVILPAKKTLDPRLGGENVAIRLVAHPYAKMLLAQTGPLTATSANLSGTPCLNSCLEAGESLGMSSLEILDGECAGGLPSTLVKISSEAEITQGSPAATIMREGILPSSRVIEWVMNSN